MYIKSLAVLQRCQKQPKLSYKERLVHFRDFDYSKVAPQQQPTHPKAWFEQSKGVAQFLAKTQNLTAENAYLKMSENPPQDAQQAGELEEARELLLLDCFKSISDAQLHNHFSFSNNFKTQSDVLKHQFYYQSLEKQYQRTFKGEHWERVAAFLQSQTYLSLTNFSDKGLSDRKLSLKFAPTEKSQKIAGLSPADESSFSVNLLQLVQGYPPTFQKRIFERFPEASAQLHSQRQQDETGSTRRPPGISPEDASLQSQLMPTQSRNKPDPQL